MSTVAPSVATMMGTRGCWANHCSKVTAGCIDRVSAAATAETLGKNATAEAAAATNSRATTSATGRPGSPRRSPAARRGTRLSGVLRAAPEIRKMPTTAREAISHKMHTTLRTAIDTYV